VFGRDAELRGTGADLPHRRVADRPASIHDFTWRWASDAVVSPCRRSTWRCVDTARAVIRSAKKLNAGALIFEIARSEIGYTEQRPLLSMRRSSSGGAARGFAGPLFIRAITSDEREEVQQPRARQGADGIRALIKEEIAAGFYNIDIDTSTSSICRRRRCRSSRK
jgi:hypothetical protein